MTAEPSLARARELIRAGLKEARAALYAIRDPQQAFDTAKVFLAEITTEVRMALSDARAEQAARIVDEESMSLSTLGRRIGFTRQGAHKELVRGRKAREAAEEQEV